MAEVTPTLPLTYGGVSPLSSSLSSSPSSLLTHGSLRDQYTIPSNISSSDDIKPSSDVLLSNGHMISVLAFSKDTYMNVSVPCNVSLNYQQQPSFLPWSRLALLLYLLQGKLKNFKTKEEKPEIKIEETDSTHSQNEEGKSNNPNTTTTQEAFTCICYYGINDDDDDDANSWSGFCLKCECSYGNYDDMDYECQLDDEEEEEGEGESEGEEEEEYNEQNIQDDDDDDDDDFIVQFACVSVSLSSPDPVVPRMSFLAPPPPFLQHVSSFSSDESGFCERSNIDSSSNGEEEEEEEKESVCVFDEGLWHEFEEQACFSGTNSFFRSCPISPPIDAINSDSGSEVTLMEDVDLPPVHHHLRDNDEESKDQTLQSSSCRRVRFKPDPQVHYMVTWRHAYKMARKGHWEQLGLDRDRFQKRIETIGKAIGPCLLKKLEKMKVQGASNDESPVLVDVK